MRAVKNILMHVLHRPAGSASPIKPDASTRSPLRLCVRHELTAHKIVIGQLLVTASTALTFWLWEKPAAGQAAFVGGLISTLASYYFATRVFRYDGRSPPDRLLRALYVGEVLKIGITVALLLFAIVVLKVDVLYLVLGYGATLPVYWLALLLPQPQINLEQKSRKQ